MNEKMSVLFMQWGQFLAHDITQVNLNKQEIHKM